MSTDIKMESAPTLESPGLNNHVHPEFTEAPGQSSPNGIANQASPPAPAHPALPHGYGPPQPGQNEAHIDPELRSVQEAGASPSYPPPSGMMPVTVSSPPDQTGPMQGVAAAPNVGYSMAGVDTSPDGRKQKRELSQSKRAAQNRAAQRAFRQRKEGYIKKLEQEVKEAEDIKLSYQALQAESETLRIYVIDLQSKLLDLQGTCPPPPANINLNHPRAVMMAPVAPPAPTTAAAGSSLEAVAQAVAGMTRDARDVRAESREAEDLSRQLQGGMSDGLPAATM